MAVAPLTWQSVAAPDFRGTMVGLGISNEALNRAFTGLSDSLGKFDTYRKDAALADILSATTAIQNPADIRPALGNLGVGRLGPAQFAALDAALSGRIKQAGDLEANRHATVLNPITEQSAQAKLEDFQLRAPLERDQIVANTGLTRANTGLVGANTARVNQQTRFDAEAQPERLQSLRLGNEAAALANDQSIFRNQKDKTDYEDNNAANVIAAEVLRRTGPNAATDAEAALEGQRGNISPRVFALAMDKVRATTGAYGAGGQAPGTGGGSGRSGSNPAGASAPSPAPGLLPSLPGHEGIADTTNARSRAVSSLGAAVERFAGDTDRATGASSILAAQNNPAPLNQVVASLKVKGSPFEDIDARQITTAVQRIKAEARTMWLDLTDAAAVTLLMRNPNFDTAWLPSLKGLPGSQNPLELQMPSLRKDLEALENGTLAEAARSTAGITGNFQTVQAAQAEATEAARLYQDAIRQAQSRPGLQERLPEYRRVAEAKAQRAQAMLDRFMTDNKTVLEGKKPVPIRRVPAGTTPAQVDESSLLPSQYAPVSAPPVERRGASGFVRSLWDRAVR